MRKQVNDKRDKFTKQIRAKQHEQYFQLHRQANKSSDLPALAYIPVLLQNQLYDDIQAIMDCIDLGYNTNQSESYSDLIKIINDRFNHHSNENVRLMMFKLLNRLNQWTVQDVGRAIKMVKQGKQEMIKQLSIHFQVQTSSDPQTNKPSIQKQLNQTFAQILSIKIQNPEYRLFWLDLICQTLQTSPAQIKKCLEDPNSFLFAIDLGINAENQFQIVRVLKIVSVLVTYKQLQPRIIQLQCFSKLITIIENGSIDVLFLGLDLLAELLAYDDIVVARLLNGYKIMNIFKKYLEHIMVGVQARVLWALSNIAGSQHHKIVLMDTQIMEQLNRKVKNPTNPQILSQACCCLLNLLCNSTGQQLQSIDQQINISELIIKVLEQIEQPVIRDTLLERTLYSIYHVLNDFPQSYLKLEQLGLKKFLSSLFQLERDENRLKMIQQVLRVVEKKEKLT